MTDIIIVLILVVLIAIGVRATSKHFKGEGSCCGGGTYKPRKKKLDSVVSKRTFSVEGMTCQHCENRVHEAINAIQGASAQVSHKKGIAVVSMSQPIEDGVIKAAIEKAGYMVSGIH